MRHSVMMPDLCGAGQPLRLSAWFVDPGEVVDEGERLFEVLLPGITCDVKSPCSGRLVKIEKPLDALVAEGDIVGWIETLPVSDQGDELNA